MHVLGRNRNLGAGEQLHCDRERHERRADDDVDTFELLLAKAEAELRRFARALVHLPVACDQLHTSSEGPAQTDGQVLTWGSIAGLLRVDEAVVEHAEGMSLERDRQSAEDDPDDPAPDPVHPWPPRRRSAGLR